MPVREQANQLLADVYDLIEEWDDLNHLIREDEELEDNLKIAKDVLSDSISRVKTLKRQAHLDEQSIKQLLKNP